MYQKSKAFFHFYNTDDMLGPNGSKPWNKKNPWHAPGTADIYSPCGTFGGNPQGCRGGPPIERLESRSVIRLSHYKILHFSFPIRH